MQILYLFLFLQKTIACCFLCYKIYGLLFILQNIWVIDQIACLLWVIDEWCPDVPVMSRMSWCSTDAQDSLMFQWCTGCLDVPVMSAFAEISLYLFCRDLPAFCWQYFVWLLSDLFGCDEFFNWIVLASALWWSASMKARPKLCALLSFSTGVPQSSQIAVFLAPSVSGCRNHFWTSSKEFLSTWLNSLQMFWFSF